MVVSGVIGLVLLFLHLILNSTVSSCGFASNPAPVRLYGCFWWFLGGVFVVLASDLRFVW